MPGAASVEHLYDRERMVRALREQRGISDPRVLEALLTVPRHRFVREDLGARAYKDFALPIGCDQTISQPYVVAKMTELLQVGAEDSVLEIGTGSGYQTAILALLAKRVYSIERVAELAHRAIRRISALGMQNVKILVFDGTVGFSEAAPYERILVAAGARTVPAPLLEQLKPRGRLVIPEGDRDSQRLVVYEKDPWGMPHRQEGAAVTFVPLIGRHGWSEP